MCSLYVSTMMNMIEIEIECDLATELYCCDLIQFRCPSTIIVISEIDGYVWRSIRIVFLHRNVFNSLHFTYRMHKAH